MKFIKYLVFFIIAIFLVGCDGLTEEPKNEHQHSYNVEVIEPTCLDGGFSRYKCECGDSYESDYTDPIGHQFGKWNVIVEPTEESEGKEERICSVCQEKEEQSIDRIVMYNIYYYGLDNSLLKTEKYLPYSSVELDYQIEVEGYKFEGWSNEESLNNIITGVIVDGDIVLYAKLTKIHTVNFYNYDGTLLETKQFLDGEWLADAPTPYSNDIYTKYDFHGWGVEQIYSDLELEPQYTTEPTYFEVDFVFEGTTNEVVKEYFLLSVGVNTIKYGDDLQIREPYCDEVKTCTLKEWKIVYPTTRDGRVTATAVVEEKENLYNVEFDYSLMESIADFYVIDEKPNQVIKYNETPILPDVYYRTNYSYGEIMINSIIYLPELSKATVYLTTSGSSENYYLNSEGTIKILDYYEKDYVYLDDKCYETTLIIDANHRRIYANLDGTLYTFNYMGYETKDTFVNLILSYDTFDFSTKLKSISSHILIDTESLKAFYLAYEEDNIIEGTYEIEEGYYKLTFNGLCGYLMKDEELYAEQFLVFGTSLEEAKKFNSESFNGSNTFIDDYVVFDNYMYHANAELIIYTDELYSVTTNDYYDLYEMNTIVGKKFYCSNKVNGNSFNYYESDIHKFNEFTLILGGSNIVYEDKDATINRIINSDDYFIISNEKYYLFDGQNLTEIFKISNNKYVNDMICITVSSNDYLISDVMDLGDNNYRADGVFYSYVDNEYVLTSKERTEFDETTSEILFEKESNVICYVDANDNIKYHPANYVEDYYFYGEMEVLGEDIYLFKNLYDNNSWTLLNQIIGDYSSLIKKQDGDIILLNNGYAIYENIAYEYRMLDDRFVLLQTSLYSPEVMQYNGYIYDMVNNSISEEFTLYNEVITETFEHYLTYVDGTEYNTFISSNYMYINKLLTGYSKKGSIIELHNNKFKDNTLYLEYRDGYYYDCPNAVTIYSYEGSYTVLKNYLDNYELTYENEYASVFDDEFYALNGKGKYLKTKIGNEEYVYKFETRFTIVDIKIVNNKIYIFYENGLQIDLINGDKSVENVGMYDRSYEKEDGTYYFNNETLEGYFISTELEKELQVSETLVNISKYSYQNENYKLYVSNSHIYLVTGSQIKMFETDLVGDSAFGEIVINNNYYLVVLRNNEVCVIELTKNFK